MYFEIHDVSELRAIRNALRWHKIDLTEKMHWLHTARDIKELAAAKALLKRLPARLLADELIAEIERKSALGEIQ